MSHVIVSSEKVRKVCDVKIAHVKMLKAWNLACHVYEEAHRKPWFGKPIGYQRAFDAIMNDRNRKMEILFENCHYNDVLEECNKLLILAKIGDPVVITHEHAYIFKEVLHEHN